MGKHREENVGSGVQCWTAVGVFHILVVHGDQQDSTNQLEILDVSHSGSRRANIFSEGKIVRVLFAMRKYFLQVFGPCVSSAIIWFCLAPNSAAQQAKPNPLAPKAEGVTQEKQKTPATVHELTQND